VECPSGISSNLSLSASPCWSASKPIGRSSSLRVLAQETLLLRRSPLKTPSCCLAVRSAASKARNSPKVYFCPRKKGNWILHILLDMAVRRNRARSAMGRSSTSDLRWRERRLLAASMKVASGVDDDRPAGHRLGAAYRDHVGAVVLVGGHFQQRRCDVSSRVPMRAADSGAPGVPLMSADGV
jgi:hypothetical protein